MITRVLLERLQLYLGVPWRHKIEVAMKLDDENILRMADKRVRPRNLSQTQTKAVTSSRNNWTDLKTWANWIVISMMKFIVAILDSENSSLSGPDEIGFIKTIQLVRS